MVTLDSITAPPRVAPPPDVIRYGPASRRTKRGGVARRFWTLEEAAEKLGTGYNALLHQVHRCRLPVVVLPSTLDRPVHRRRLAVPDVWLRDGRWYDMARFAGQDAIDARRVYTLPGALRAEGDALAMTVQQAATACSLSQRHAYELIRLGRFCATGIRPGGRGLVVHTADLDAWACELIRAAEAEWYAGRSAGAPRTAGAA